MEEETADPYFRRMFEHCQAKPGAVEDHPWGETVFKIKGKVFAFLGTPDGSSITVKPAKDDLDAMLALPFIQRAAYIGRYGWVRVTVQDEEALDLALELIDDTYEGIASPKKRR